LATANGDVIWEKQLTEDYEAKPPFWGYASHPFVDGENLIVPVGGNGTGLVAFEKKTGKEVWRSVTTNDIGYAPVVMYQPEDANGERQLVFWHGRGITAINPDDGTELWEVSFPKEANPSIVTIATPVLVGNKLLIAEFYKGAVLLEIGSNPPSVKEVWRNFEKNPKLDDALNAMMATPVVKDGLAYGVAYNKRGEGLLRCVELESGDMKWTDENWMGDKPLMFANGFFTPNEDKYFVFNDIGELVIATLSSEGFQELGRARLLEPTSVARGRDVVWSHPAYSDGKMVVRNDKEIICVDLKK
jgi:outer membrane protein assembly factor BamB